MNFFRTVFRLSVSPGAVCIDFASGSKARWMHPLSYAFLWAAAFVAVILLLKVNVAQGFQRLTGNEAAFNPAEQGIINSIHFAVLPATALLTLAAFRRSGYRFRDHFAFVLFTHGHVFALYAVAAPLGGFSTSELWLALHLLPVAYQAWAGWEFYGGPAFWLILKLLVVQGAHMVLVSVVSAVVIASM